MNQRAKNVEQHLLVGILALAVVPVICAVAIWRRAVTTAVCPETTGDITSGEIARGPAR